MGEERRFPCPYCGFEFHYTPDEPRKMVPCLKCGKGLIMPHGRFYNRSDEVFGCHPGWRTPEELDKITRKNAIWMIRRWEELTR